MSPAAETGLIAIEEHLIVPSQREHLTESHPLDVKRELLLDYGAQRLQDSIHCRPHGTINLQ